MKNLSSDLFVADSFLVKINGGSATVSALQKHLVRFSNQVFELCVRENLPAEAVSLDLESFLNTVPQILKTFNSDAFPRLEFAIINGNPTFNLNLRPAPVISEFQIIAASAETVFKNSDLKGPNIRNYNELCRLYGGETILFCPETDVALETTTSALVWWSGDVLNFLDSTHDKKRVSSVTEKVLLWAASSMGIEVKQSELLEADLCEHEVWTLNSLHGIRPVIEIATVKPRAFDPERLTLFRKLISQTYEPID